MSPFSKKLSPLLNAVAPRDETPADKIIPDLMNKAEIEDAKRAIDEVYLKGKPAQTAPQLLYVTGLAGSGKSTWIQDNANANAYFNLSDAVIIDFDDLRRFHPRYGALQKSDPRNAAARTNDAVLELHTYLVEAVKAKSVNVILDDVVMGQEITKDILDGFKTGGYAVDCVVKLRPFSECYAGVMARYEVGLKSGDPRWVDTNEQNQGPENLIGTLTAIFDADHVQSLCLSTVHGNAKSSLPLNSGQKARILNAARHVTSGRKPMPTGAVRKKP